MYAGLETSCEDRFAAVEARKMIEARSWILDVVIVLRMPSFFSIASLRGCSCGVVRDE
jgi:hypothetical protein